MNRGSLIDGTSGMGYRARYSSPPSEHQLGWEPGQWGKGLVQEGTYGNYWPKPDGNHFYEPVAGERQHHERAAELLKAQLPEFEWKFSKVAINVHELGQPTFEGDRYHGQRKPFVYIPKTQDLLIGPEGGDHQNMIYRDPRGKRFKNLMTDDDIAHGGVYRHPNGQNVVEFYGEPPDKEHLQPIADALGADRIQTNEWHVGDESHDRPDQLWDFTSHTAAFDGSYYHVAPTAMREKIMREGLMGHEKEHTHSPWNNIREKWRDQIDQPGGNYAFDDIDNARDYVPPFGEERSETPGQDQNQFAEHGVYTDPTTGKAYMEPEGWDPESDEEPDYVEYNHMNPEHRALLPSHLQGHDIWRIDPAGYTAFPDPESALLGGRAGDIGEAQEKVHGEMSDDGEDYDVEKQPLRWWFPQHIPPASLQLAQHMPAFNRTEQNAMRRLEDEEDPINGMNSPQWEREHPIAYQDLHPTSMPLMPPPGSLTSRWEFVSNSTHTHHFNPWSGAFCTCPYNSLHRTMQRYAGMHINKVLKAPDKALQTPEGEAFKKFLAEHLPEEHESLAPWLAHRFKKGDIRLGPYPVQTGIGEPAKQTLEWWNKAVPKTAFDHQWNEQEQQAQPVEDPTGILHGLGMDKSVPEERRATEDRQFETLFPAELDRWHAWYEAKQHPLRKGVNVMDKNFTPFEMSEHGRKHDAAIREQKQLDEYSHRGSTVHTFPAIKGGDQYGNTIDWDSVEENESNGSRNMPEPEEGMSQDRFNALRGADERLQRSPYEAEHMDPHILDELESLRGMYPKHTTPRPAGWHIKELHNAEDAEAEGHMMGHCFGSEEQPYSRCLDNGDITAYSLRDPKGKPHVTWHYNSDGGLAEMFGPNDDPVKPEYQDMLNEWGAKNDREVDADNADGMQEQAEDPYVTLPEADNIESYAWYHHPERQLESAQDMETNVGPNTEIEPEPANWNTIAEDYLDKMPPQPQVGDLNHPENERHQRERYASEYDKFHDTLNENPTHDEDMHFAIADRLGERWPRYPELDETDEPMDDHWAENIHRWNNWYNSPQNRGYSPNMIVPIPLPANTPKPSLMDPDVNDHQMQMFTSWTFLGQTNRRKFLTTTQDHERGKKRWGLPKPHSLRAVVPFHKPRKRGAVDPDWLNQWIEKNGPYMTHSTDAEETRDKILQEGLIPHDQGLGSQYDGTLAPRANHSYIGRNLAGLDVSKNDRTLAIDLRKLDPSRINADEDAFWDKTERAHPEIAKPTEVGGLFHPRGMPVQVVDSENQKAYPSFGAWADDRQLNEPKHSSWSMNQLGTAAIQGGVSPEALVHPQTARQDLSENWPHVYLPSDYDSKTHTKIPYAPEEAPEEFQEKAARWEFVKVADKLHDFLMNPKSRPAMSESDARPWEPGQYGKGIYYPDNDHLVTWGDDRHHSDVWFDDEHGQIPGAAHHLDIMPDGTVRDQGAFDRNYDDAEPHPNLEFVLKQHDPRLRLDNNAWDFGQSVEPQQEEPSMSRGEQGGGNHNVEFGNDEPGVGTVNG